MALNKLSLAWLKDAAERVVSTYVVALITLYLAADVKNIDVSTLHTMALSAVPAALTAVKTLLASQFGDADTGGFVKPKEEVPVVEAPVDVPAAPEATPLSPPSVQGPVSPV